jgi:uncharacterized repeat protein (TIGR01451 family)
VTLSGPFSVTDDKATVTCTQPGDGQLSPNETMNCSATHSTTQADLDAGFITNHATASGGGAVSVEASATATGGQTKTLGLTKTANPTTYSAVGQSIAYSYVIKNTGNVTLSGPFSVTDDKVTVTCTQPGDGQLSPNETMNCSATHSTTQADLDAGSITNHATASGGGASSLEASATATAAQTRTISLTKTANPTTYSTVGQNIAYSYVIKNTGNVTLSGPFSATDDKVTVTCTQPGDGQLSPNETMSCSATHTMTQADLDAGAVTNQATATGGGVSSNQTQATVTAVRNAAITIVKSTNGADADAAPGPSVLVGSTVQWTYSVKNTGNVTLSNVGVSDDKGVAVTCPQTILAPAAAIVCTASGVATPGQYSNTGTVTASPPAGANVTASNPSHYLGVAPDLVITKSEGGGATTPGATVIYTLAYRNDGTQGATGVSINETVPTHATFVAASSSAGWSCANGSGAGTSCKLQIGAVATGGSGSRTFAVKVESPAPADLAQLSNTATIGDDGANGPDLTPANNTATDTTPVNATPSLTLQMARQDAATPGMAIRYSLSYANSGNRQAVGVTLHETVPADTTFNALASTTGWDCPNGGVGGSSCSFSIGSLSGAGGGGTVTFAVTVDIPQATGTAITNQARIIDSLGTTAQASDATTVGAGPSRTIVNRGAHAVWQYGGDTYQGSSGPDVFGMAIFLPLILKTY